MKFICLLLAFAATVHLAIAQSELEAEILNITDTSKLAITNTRRLMMDKIQAGNYIAATELANYLKSKVDTSTYLTFNPWEEQLIGYFSHNIGLFEQATKRFDQRINKRMTPKDGFSGKCLGQIIADDSLHNVWVTDTTLSPEQAKLIRIFMGFVDIYPNKYENMLEARHFKKQFPESELKPWVKFVAEKFDVLMEEGSIGSGFLNLNGPAKQYFPNSSLLYFNVGGFYNRFYYSVDLSQLMDAKLLLPTTIFDAKENPISLLKGDKLNFLNMNLRFGWQVYQKNRMTVYPYVIPGFYSVEYRIKENETASVCGGFSLGAGVGAEYALAIWKSNDFYGNKTLQNKFSLKTNLNYQHNFSNDRTFSADCLYFNFGLSLCTEKEIRRRYRF